MTATPSIPERQLAVWERWWSAVNGAPGEIVWDPDTSDLAADLEIFGRSFDPDLPVIDLGCGNGRQTRFLARRFRTVVGVDISPSAIERAAAAENPANVSYRVLDAATIEQAGRLHHELGDANVYVRGVLQALPRVARPYAVDSIAMLLGKSGTLFAKELPPQTADYFADLVQRHGLWPELERVMRQIPPGQITEPELVSLFSPDRFEVICTGAGHIDTRNVLPDGEAIRVPAICALIRPHQADRSTLATEAEDEHA
jgi:SAM-dependent methyltransferase